MKNKLPKVTEKDIDKVSKEKAEKLEKKWRDGLEMHQHRIVGFKFFSRVAHNLTLYEKAGKDAFSEGSTQAIKRKIRAQTLQRVPDGEIVTPFDKNTVEQTAIDYIFKHKVLTSEYDGKDMMKQLWKTFNASYDYGFGCVRTGFEKDLDGDPRISYTLIPYNDVIPSPDCKSIEEADWYIIREYIPKSKLRGLINWETGEAKDSTYDATVLRCIVENDMKSGTEVNSAPLADNKKGVTPNHSIEVRTYYCRGADEFITYVPSLKAILRKVKNYDPRKDVPIHFLILEPDPEFPYGCSSVMWTIAQQQYADAFQSTAYQTLLLSLKPPMQVFGNIVNPKMKMKPGAIWPMGTNPNNKIEPYRVETTTITQYGSILENISARMMNSLNITDSTVASDAKVPGYSATPQGVEQQRLDKTITVNQYQKRVEIFFSEWANHALRSYINSMSGKQEITVDAKTRKRIESIEEAARKSRELEMKQALGPELTDEAMADMAEDDSVINGNKIEVDFDVLHEDSLFEFEVRTGSLIENERETERDNIQQMLVPISQMLGNVSDPNKETFESMIMSLIMRLCELSDIDISASLASKVNENLVMSALQATMDMVAGQQQQLDQMAQQMPMMPQGGAPAAAMPPEGMPPEGMQPEMPPGEGDDFEQEPMMEQELPMLAEGAGMPAEGAGLPPDIMPELNNQPLPQ